MGAVAEPIRVGLVDDDPLVLTGLAAMLDGAGDIRVVGRAADGREVPDLIARHRPDVILMDLRMPHVDGITATRRLTAADHHPAVIVLTTFHDDELVVRALHAGAVGYLLKHTAPDQIVQAVGIVHRGGSMLSPEVARGVVDTIAGQADTTGERARARRLLDRLTPREYDVALAVADGNSNGDIAAELHLSVATVKAHITVLLRKLNADNRVQLALLIQSAAR